MVLKMNKDNIINVDDIDIVQDVRMNLDENKQVARIKFSLMDNNSQPIPFDFHIQYTKPKVSLKGGNISITGTEMEKKKDLSIEATVGMSGNPTIVAVYAGVKKDIYSFDDLRSLLLQSL